MENQPIDWKTPAALAREWAETRVFPEEKARAYWAAQGLVRPQWSPGRNIWIDRSEVE